MINKINNIQLETLSLFTKGYDKEYYIREVTRKLKVSPRTALITLAKLEKRGILESKTKGRIKFYSIRKSGLSREFMVLTEQYKKIRFFEKNPLIREVLEKTDGFMKGIVIVFGTYAKGTQNGDSDLDLFIAGRHDERRIKPFGKKYGIEVNVKSYPMKIFEKGIGEDVLLREIAENHVIIRDAEGFVLRAAKWIR